MTAAAVSSRTSAALTWALGLFLLLNAFALNGLLHVASPAPYKETVLTHSGGVLRGHGCDDSWGIMATALDYAKAPHTTPLYAELFFNRKLKFQYPPSSLFALAAMFEIAGRANVRTDECKAHPTTPINDYLGWFFILLAAAASAALLELGLRKRGVQSSVSLVAARGALMLGFALTFYPIVKGFTLGQIQIWISGGFALALLLWTLGYKASSGVLIGLMCLIKPHYGVFVLWGLLRREWRFAVGCFAMVVAGVVAGFAVFGWTDNVDYLRVFWFLSQHGETFYPNQSINGLLNRLMSIADPANYNNVQFMDQSFPPFTLWIYLTVVATTVAIVGLALFRRGTAGNPDRTLDVATMAVCITMASPIAWEHHYGLVLPIFAAMLPAVLADRARLTWLAVSYVLISNFVPVTQLLAPTWANIVQSYLFAGAVILLVMLHRLRIGARAPAAARVPIAAPMGHMQPAHAWARGNAEPVRAG